MKKRKVIASIVAVCFSLALLSTWVMIFGCMKRGEQELHANTSMEIPDMSSIPGCVQNGQFYDACRGNKYNCAGNRQHNLSGDGMHERIVPGLVQKI